MSMTVGSEELRLLRHALADRYTIERELGHGSFATVFLGSDLRHDRLVAIKLLKPQYATGEHERRFGREIRLLARLQHPHILPLLDSGQVLDMLYYVVPYAREHSLGDRIERERQLPIDDVIRIACEVADALDYAHRNGVIHRDIKPENILLSDAHAILADFGIAFAADPAAGERLTRSSLGGIGTPLYMSPEQFASGREADARSDIYSLGCVMYEMLTGTPPCVGTGAVMRRFTEPAPSCFGARPDVPAALDRIIATALAADPEERFNTAGLLARALEGLGRRSEDPGALPSESAAPGVLEVTSSRLIGRESELVMLGTLLKTNRLLTLVGPGGIGKSRLASATAASVHSRFRDGHLVVSLGAISSPELVVPAIAAAMQFVFSGPQEPRLQLVDRLREQHVLLVLDGFEHLMGAAAIVAEMCDAAPHVSILVTSRERLNLRNESVFEVHGLKVGTQGEAGASALFIDRASRSQPDFSPSVTDRKAIEEICTAVAGLPLGIEIAASLVRVMSCTEIVEELERDPGALVTPLRDIPDGHRSLRAVFERSWELLTDEERGVLMRLSVFHGPFDRTAATQVAGATLATLGALLDKSLLQREANGRFGLHAVVRQFAESKLRDEANRAAAAEEARGRYYCDWLRRRERDLRGARIYETVEEMAEQAEDIRHGWRRVLRENDASVATYVEALYRFYLVQGRYREGAGELALSDGHRLSDRVNGLVLARRSSLALHALDLVEARRLATASINALRPRFLGSAEIGIAIAQLGYVASVQGRHRVASRLYGRALLLLRAHVGYESEVGYTLIRLGIAQIALGSFDAAEATYEEALEIFDRTVEPRARAMTMSNFAFMLSDAGRTDEALEMRQKVLMIAESTPDWFLRSAAQLNLGGSLSEARRFDEARELIGRALDGFRANGRRDGIVMCRLMRGMLERDAATDLEDAEHYLLTAIGEAEEIGATSYAMEGVCELGLLRAAQGRPAEALSLVDVALRHAATTEASRRKARALRERLAAELPDLAERPAAPRPLPGDYAKRLDATSSPT
jgi:predicted ATPase